MTPGTPTPERWTVHDGPSAESGRTRTDPRLPAYLIAGFGALVLAIITGTPEVAALAAPLLALAAAGLPTRARPGVRGRVTLEATQALEGDLVSGTVEVEWNGEGEVDVVLTGLQGVSPVEPEHGIGWALEGAGPATLNFTVRARAWGLHDVGTLWVRIRRPGSLLISEHRVATAPSLRVLPAPMQLRRILKSSAPRTYAGEHRSRLRGQGSDFAELRPYQPGDRLRDISWTASARSSVPWVTVRHPERASTVVLLLDTSTAGSPEALARTARVAWAVASAHLKSHDRVGLLAQGRAPAWIPPRGGRRGRWLLLNQLLTVGRNAELRARPGRRVRHPAVPSDALIVGVTGVRSEIFTSNLFHYRRSGHPTVALLIDTSDLLPRTGDPSVEAARRIYAMQHHVQRQALERGGIHSALVSGTGASVGLALRTLENRLSQSHSPRAAAVRGLSGGEAAASGVGT